MTDANLSVPTIDVEIDSLRRLLERAFAGAGTSEEEARLITDALVEAELREVPTHGILRVPGYLDGLLSGRYNPRAEVRVIFERPAAVLLDADNALGYIPTWRAAGLAVEKAREHGIGVAGVRNSNEFGRGAYYTEFIAAQGFVSIVCANTRPMLGPPGAKMATHGNNPLAFATPGTDGPSFDASFTPRAGGEVVRRRLLGLRLEAEWDYRDSQGNLTTDPEAAMAGVMPAAGGAKGFGIAVLADLWAGVLTGAASGPDVPLNNSRVGAFVLAVSPNILGEGETIEGAMQRGADAVRTAGGRWPGDRARAARSANRGRGCISVPRAIAQRAQESIMALKGLETEARRVLEQ